MEMMPKIYLLMLAIFSLFLLLASPPALAELPASANFRVAAAGFDMGGCGNDPVTEKRSSPSFYLVDSSGPEAISLGHSGAPYCGDGNYHGYAEVLVSALDTTAPGIENHESGGDDNWRNSGGTVYDLDFTDFGGMLDYAQYAIWSGEGMTGTKLKDWTVIADYAAQTYRADWEVDFTALSEGIGYVSVRAADLEANFFSLTDAFYIRKDTGVPAASAGLDSDHADDGVVTVEIDHTFSWDAVASLSGIADWYYTTDGGDPTEVSASTGSGEIRTFDYFGVPDGSHTIKVRAVNNAGTLGEVSSFSLLVDSGNPDIVALAAGPSDADRESISSGTWMNYQDTGSDGKLSFSWTDPNSPSGNAFYYELNFDSGPTIIGTEDNVTDPYVDGIAIGEGTSYFHVRPRNGLGDWGEERIFIVRYDRTAPGAAVISSASHPAEVNWYAVDDPEFSWTSVQSGDVAPVYYYYLLDREAERTADYVRENADGMKDDADRGVSYSSQANDVWYLHLAVRDEAGNNAESAASYTVRIDDESPGAPAAIESDRTEDGVWTADADHLFTWEAPVSVSGIAGYSVGLDADPDETINAESASYDWNGVADGEHVFQVKARNNAGTWGAVASFSLKVDSAPPEIGEVSAGPSSADRTSLISGVWFNYAASGSDDEISFAWADPGSLSGDVFYYELNSDAADTVTGVEDTVSTPYGDGVAIGEGVSYFHVRPRNGAGTWGEEKIFVVRYDKTNPTSLSYRVPGGGFSEGACGNALIEKAASGSYRLIYNVGQGVGLEDAVYAEPAAPGEEKMYSGILHSYLDTTAPGPAGRPETISPTENRTPVWSWTEAADNPGGCGLHGEYAYRVFWSRQTGGEDNDAWVAFNSFTHTEELEDGFWYGKVRAYDGEFNESTESPIGVVIVSDPPDIVAIQGFRESSHIEEIIEGAWQNDDEVSFTWTEPLSPFGDTFYYRCDESAEASLLSDGENADGYVSVAEINDYPLSEGSRYFHVQPLNGYGQWGEERIFNIRYEGTGPGLASGGSSTGHSLSAWSNLSVIEASWEAATDNLSGIGGYSVLWDTAEGTLPDEVKNQGEGELSSSSPIQPTSDSIYLHVRALDGAGNWSEGAYHYGPFYVDVDPPAAVTGLAEIFGPAPGSWSNQSAVTLGWTEAEDPDSGIDGYAIGIDTSPSGWLGTEKDVAAGLGEKTVSIPDGTENYFHIRSLDNAGNWGGTADRGPYWIDTIPPDIQAVSCYSDSSRTEEVPEAAWMAETTPYFTWEAPESESPIVGYRYALDAAPSGEYLLGETFVDYASDPIAEGKHIFQVQAKDMAGNEGEVGTFQLWAGVPRGPIVRLTLLLHGYLDETTFTQQSATLSVEFRTVRDQASGIAFDFDLDGGGDSGEQQLDNLEPETYYVLVRQKISGTTFDGGEIPLGSNHLAAVTEEALEFIESELTEVNFSDQSGPAFVEVCVSNHPQASSPMLAVGSSGRYLMLGGGNADGNDLINVADILKWDTLVGFPDADDRGEARFSEQGNFDGNARIDGYDFNIWKRMVNEGITYAPLP